MLRNLLFCLLLLVIFTSCEDTQLETPGEIYLDLATDYDYNFSFNTRDTISNAQATLGRVLFYDRQLSVNNTVACASCHKQEFGFSDNRRFSVGFEGRSTSRNSMPLQNLATLGIIDFEIAKSSFAPTGFAPGGTFTVGNHFFWDGRETSLEKLILQPVGNHIEMGITNVDDLAKKLSALPYYAPLFKKAFEHGPIEYVNQPTISGDKISKAITMFITRIQTTNTRLDQANTFFATTNTIFSPSTVAPNNMNALELEGMALFRSKYDCNSCHQVDSPSGYQFAGTFANIGLDPEYNDPGLADKTNVSEDIGRFKIPSLRNISYTAPYMHDGRFNTLDEVLEHYSEGIADHPNLDARLKNSDGNARKMNITKHEKEAIIAFLQTLNDESVIRDLKFSNPFKLR